MAVQVQMVLDRPFAAPQPAQHVRTDSAAAIRQRLVGVEQTFDVDLVRQRFAQRRLIVALALACPRCDRCWRVQAPVRRRQRCDAVQRRPEFAGAAGCGQVSGALASLAILRRALRRHEALAQRRQLLDVVRPARHRNSFCMRNASGEPKAFGVRQAECRPQAATATAGAALSARASSQRWASSAAMQPVAAEVTAWR